MKYNCPQCQSEVQWSNENAFRPFCSEQCKNHDFINWANEEHSIKGSSVYDDVLSDDLHLAEKLQELQGKL